MPHKGNNFWFNDPFQHRPDSLYRAETGRYGIWLLPSALFSSYANSRLVWSQDLVKVFKGNTKVPVNGKTPQILCFPDWIWGRRGQEGVILIYFSKINPVCTGKQKHIHVPLYPVSSASGSLSYYPQAFEHPRAECTALCAGVTWLLPQCIKYQRAPKAAGLLALPAVDLWCLHLLSSTCQHIKGWEHFPSRFSSRIWFGVGFLWEFLCIHTHVTESLLTQHHFVLCDPSQKR